MHLQAWYHLPDVSVTNTSRGIILGVRICVSLHADKMHGDVSVTSLDPTLVRIAPPYSDWYVKPSRLREAEVWTLFSLLFSTYCVWVKQIVSHQDLTITTADDPKTALHGSRVDRHIRLCVRSLLFCSSKQRNIDTYMAGRWIASLCLFADPRFPRRPLLQPLPVVAIDAYLADTLH